MKNPAARAAAPIALVLFAAAIAFAAPPRAAERPKDADARGTLYHVVSLKFQDDATREQIKAVEQAFRGLKDKVPGITSLQWGTNVSPEKLNKGFTHCFILTFVNEKDRDAYLVHPDHDAFGKVLKPVLADVFVIDFVAR
jgi:hypothetical protein